MNELLNVMSRIIISKYCLKLTNLITINSLPFYHLKTQNNTNNNFGVNTEDVVKLISNIFKYYRFLQLHLLIFREIYQPIRCTLLTLKHFIQPAIQSLHDIKSFEATYIIKLEDTKFIVRQRILTSFLNYDEIQDYNE